MSLQRVYNFGAGPAMLPNEILERIQAELFDWRGTGVSVMEIGHRTKIFQDLLINLQQKLRSLMQIPNNYKVLFVHGGGQAQFSAIPMNLLKYNQDADYMISGIWSKKAADYAKKYAKVNVVFESGLNNLPDVSTWQFNPNAAYAYYCPNESINGIKFATIPDTSGVPLVVDMTSCILANEIDVAKFGLIFAAAQKNLGIAGVALVVIREDLLDQALDVTPPILNYKLQAEGNSSVNTPAVFPIYVMDLMVDWMIAQGGVKAISAINISKANKLYTYLDNNDFYYNSVESAYRSIVNIPFNLRKSELVEKFLSEANKVGLKYLQGHALVGGCRASLYNAMPEAGVNALIDFMRDFAARN